MLCDHALKRRYREFNQEFWNGELPEDIDIFWAPTGTCVAFTSKDEHGDFLIQISPSLAGFDIYTKLVIIHEMCHVAMWGKERKLHDSAFKKELMRVLKLGAIRYV